MVSESPSSLEGGRMKENKLEGGSIILDNAQSFFHELLCSLQVSLGLVDQPQVEVEPRAHLQQLPGGVDRINSDRIIPQGTSPVRQCPDQSITDIEAT